MEERDEREKDVLCARKVLHDLIDSLPAEGLSPVRCDAFVRVVRATLNCWVQNEKLPPYPTSITTLASREGSPT